MSEVNYQKVFSCTGAKLLVGSYLDACSTVALACANKFSREVTEVLLATFWRQYPHITDYTKGVITEDEMANSWMTITCNGLVLPTTSGMHASIARLGAGREEMCKLAQHSVFWQNDRAYEMIVHWFQVVYKGKVRRDEDLLDQMEALENNYLDHMSREVPNLLNDTGTGLRNWVGPYTSKRTCRRAHAVGDLQKFATSSGMMWQRLVHRHIRHAMVIVKLPHTIIPYLSTGFTKVIKGMSVEEVHVEFYPLVKQFAKEDDCLDKEARREILKSNLRR